jgi:hypothetical protein
LDALPASMYASRVLHFTPRKRLLDPEGRPYFLWDSDLTLERYMVLLRDPDEHVRAYLIGKTMRQAKPDDVFQFVTLGEIEALWPRIVPFLGRSREFWTWLLGKWREQGRAAG